MAKIKSLDKFQIGIIILMVAMTLIFAVVYMITTSKIGFEFNDKILVPSEGDGEICYSGKLGGEDACFTVTEDKTVTFQHGDKTYGPYIAKNDPTAIPKGDVNASNMTGIEILEGDNILFRGGIEEVGSSFWLYNEDGSFHDFGFLYTGGDGIVCDEDGKEIDPYEPSVKTIINLINEPELTHKGEWSIFILGFFFCVMTTVSILFADELFRWALSFRIRNVEAAEASDWEIATRYISWAAFAILAFVCYFMGLR